MGKEFQVNSLEDMCDLMCNNYICEDEPEEKWVFTFGSGQEHEGHYVIIFGSFNEAREKMIKRFGTQWAFQYSEQEWEEMKHDPNRCWPMEKPLEEE